LAALVATGVRVPGGLLARAIASRILCAVALADSCGDEPALIAAYGTEIAELARRQMPMLAFERDSRAVPIDFRRCRDSECGDAAGHGLIEVTDAGLPVTAFVHAIDCREDEAARTEAAGGDCSGERAGNLYLQYWLYYADSATLRGVPVAGKKGYHEDDWESVQLRIDPDDDVQERASSHHGYNSSRRPSNWAYDSGALAHDGWGPETRLLLVAGGSHAGSTIGLENTDRFTPGRRVNLVPLEQIASQSAAHFAISPPWRKHVWLDPEAEGTD
jgi:hypothetical protein